MVPFTFNYSSSLSLLSPSSLSTILTLSTSGCYMLLISSINTSLVIAKGSNKSSSFPSPIYFGGSAIACHPDLLMYFNLVEDTLIQMGRGCISVIKYHPTILAEELSPHHCPMIHNILPVLHPTIENSLWTCWFLRVLQIHPPLLQPQSKLFIFISPFGIFTNAFRFLKFCPLDVGLMNIGGSVEGALFQNLFRTEVQMFAHLDDLGVCPSSLCTTRPSDLGSSSTANIPRHRCMVKRILLMPFG